MKYFKKGIKILLFSVLSFFVFIGLYLSAAWLLSHLKANQDWKNTKSNGVEIFVISNGVHTDIALPYDTNDALTKNLKVYQPYKMPKYVAYGWGDKGFYLDTPTWNDLTFSTAFKALFGLSSAAMHVTFYNQIPQPNEQVKKLVIDNQSLISLKTYIQQSFVLNDQKKPVYVNCCWYYNNKKDMFLDAHGRYHLFKTCNVWANDGLKAAGIKTTIWAPFDWCILKQFE